MPWLAVAMIAGAASYFGLRAEPAAWTGGAAVLLAALCTAATWRFRVPRAVAMAALVGAAGFLSAQAQTRRALPIDALPVKAAILTGTVRAVDALPEGRRVLLAGVRTDPAQPALARLVPIDLDPRGFGAEATALTLAGLIGVQIWRVEEGFALACFASFAQALADAVETAARYV